MAAMNRGRLLLLAVLQRVSQREVAARCGVSQQAVSAWATGIRQPSPVARVKLELSYRIARRWWDASQLPRD